MSSKTLPHWLSFRDRLLPRCPVPLTDVFSESLENYKELDWIGFQQLPICKSLHALNMALAETGIIPRTAAWAAYRSSSEEAYAVISFIQNGCRILRPSYGLVEQLMETDVTFPLSDIRPPWPHLFIEMPRGIDLMLPNFNNPGQFSRVVGVYVTWSQIGQATRDSFEASKKHGIVKTKIGLIPRNELVDGLEYEEVGDDIELQDIYGDWFGRFCLVARDSYSKLEHDWTVHYFNMHWNQEKAQEAEGAFSRFTANWKKTSPELGGFAVADEFRNRVFHLAANLFLYMSMPQHETDVVWQPDETRERLRIRGDRMNSKQKRNMKRRIAEELPTESWIVGQHVVIDRDIEVSDTVPGTSVDGTRASPKVHWRRGHWRGVWTGPKTGPRKLQPRWIRPVLVGQGPAPSRTVYTVK